MKIRGVKSRLLFGIIFIVGITSLSAQVKFELEHPVKRTDVPSNAVAFIENSPFTKKTKWYKENPLATYNQNPSIKLEQKRLFL